jgi:hypothetical protein
MASSGSGADLSGPPVYSEKYQARLPRVCSKMTTAPNASQAAALAQCNAEGLEGITHSVILVTDMSVEMGSPRAFMPGANNYLQDIDPEAKVYPLRGQATRWSCGEANAGNAGQNCMTWPAVANASQGSCWYTLFKEWKCTFGAGGPTWKTKVKGPTTY